MKEKAPKKHEITGLIDDVEYMYHPKVGHYGKLRVMDKDYEEVPVVIITGASADDNIEYVGNVGAFTCVPGKAPNTWIPDAEWFLTPPEDMPDELVDEPASEGKEHRFDKLCLPSATPSADPVDSRVKELAEIYQACLKASEKIYNAENPDWIAGELFRQYCAFYNK